MSEDLIGIIKSYVSNDYLQALVLLLGFVLLARLIKWLLIRNLKKWVKRTRSGFDDVLVGLLETPVYVSIILFGTSLSLGLLSLPDRALELMVSIIQTFLVVVWSRFSMRLLAELLTLFSEKTDSYIKSQTLPLFKNLGSIIVFIIALYFIFLVWNIDVTAWVASAGVMGIAISFAAKDTLANLFSGVFILADAPYRIGDFIVLDTAERGMVTHIGIRSTRLLTRDDVEITVPNAVMGNAKITNETGGPYSKNRLRVKVSVAYGSDIDQVRAILIEIAEQIEDVCDTPEPRVRFRSFGDSGLDIDLLCWIAEPVVRGRVKDAVNTAIYKRFMREGIEIPYPKRDVYVREMGEG
ncbi:MAG: mechanosensitive ion channel family protein [Gammaproteobacteria bacterium]|nr:mechanosensitive ion channel family protein [Gammaproteobacteria bacterium]